MIKLLPDFKEEDRKYWNYIEEIIHFENILFEYKRLKLIRLKNFIESQISSREFQVYIYLKELTNRDSINKFEDEIKGRLDNKIIKTEYILLKTYLNPEEINKIDIEINKILFESHQYCCNYYMLQTILVRINEILTPQEGNSDERNKEASPPKKEIDLNPSIIQDVFNCLKGYFNNKEHHNLKLILLGNSIDKRLNFKSQQNKLTDVFFQLHEQNLIFDSKEDTAYWLSEYFTYNNQGKQKNCSKSSCKDSLTKGRHSSRPAEEDRILLNIKKD